MSYTTSLTCQSDPDLFFDGSAKREAKALCLTCHQVEDCLRRTLETERLMGEVLEGVHGGTTKQERIKAHAKRGA